MLCLTIKMYALTESVTLSKIKKPSCTLVLFEIILCLAAFSFPRAQSIDSTILLDDPDLKPSDERNVCHTPECKRTASRVLSYINASLNPCDNFYKFACGQFITTNLIPGVNSVTQTSLIKNNIRRKMMNYLQNETFPTLPRYARLIKTFFNSCIDDYSNKAEKRNLNSVMEFINKTSGWPLLKNYSWEDENFQWEKFGSQLEHMNVFINFKISDEWTSIQQPKEFVISPKLYNNLLSFGQLFGVEKNDVENSLNQTFELNEKLNRIILSVRSMTREMTVNDLVQKFPNISWKEFFNNRIKPKIIDDEEVIIVHGISYLDEFNKLIPTISKRDQANYLMWRVIYKIVASYFDSINTKNYPFETCYNTMTEKFKFTWEFFYLINNFNNDSFPSDIDEMFHSIQEESITIIKNNDWLDNSTKTKLLETLETMKFETLNQYFSHDNEIDKYYENLEITPGDYLRSLSNITKFNRKQESIEFPSLGPGNRTSWRHLDNAANVNGLYKEKENLINISPSYCQGVFYDKERPQYMNYGSLGSTMGHEITHGVYITTESIYENRSIVHLWTSEAKTKYSSQFECISNRTLHYKGVKLDLYILEFSLSVSSTIDEDIADYVGIQVAYSAYEKYMETHDPEPLLPGVNYTQRQLFWISYAQMYCSAMSKEELEMYEQRDTHGIPELRVIGPVSNYINFANDFQCAPNTKMYPVKNCTMW